MKNYISILSLLSVGFLLLAGGCQTEPADQAETNEGPVVITSFYPLYFLTGEVLGDAENAKLINLVPSGVEPHDFEPSPSQLAQMESANLVIAQGGLEPWLEDVDEELEQNGVRILEVNYHLDLVADEQGAFDPHTWLDPVFAMESVDLIRDELITADTVNEALYTENAADLKARLASLHESFQVGLSDCALDAFISSHDAFGYLAARYGLEVHSVSGISPFDEPSAKQIADLIELAKAEGIRHVFFEVLASPAATEVFAEEAGLSALVLNPIEGLSVEQTGEQTGENYFTLMESNLKNLKIGLACE